MKATGGSHKRGGERDGQLDAVRPDSRDVNISDYLGREVTLQLKGLAGNNA